MSGGRRVPGWLAAVVNFFAVDIGWAACIVGAAMGMGWMGVATVAGLLALHGALNGWRPPEMAFIAGASAFGWVIDTAMAVAGAFHFPGEGAWMYLSPLWMVALWANLSTSLSTSLGWMSGRYWAAALFGGIGGPLAYWAGGKIGAISFAATPAYGVTILAVTWAVSFTFLVVAHDVYVRPHLRGRPDGQAAGR